MCLCSIGTRMLCKTYQKVQEAQPSKNVANSLSTILRFVLLFEMTTCTVSPPLRMALPLSWKHGRMANSSLSTNRRKTFTIGSWFSIWLLFMNDNLIIANSSFAFQSSRKVIRSRQLRCKHTNSPTPILDANYLAFFVLGFSFPIAKAFCHWQFIKSSAFTKVTQTLPHNDSADHWNKRDDSAEKCVNCDFANGPWSPPRVFANSKTKMQPCAWQCHSFAACTTDHHCSPCHFACLCSSSMCLTLRHTSVTSNETAVQSLCRKNDNNEAQRNGNEAFFLPKWPQKKRSHWDEVEKSQSPIDSRFAGNPNG